jgi:hypothetical protein
MTDPPRWMPDWLLCPSVDGPRGARDRAHVPSCPANHGAPRPGQLRDTRGRRGGTASEDHFIEQPAKRRRGDVSTEHPRSGISSNISFAPRSWRRSRPCGKVGCAVRAGAMLRLLYATIDSFWRQDVWGRFSCKIFCKTTL